MILKDEEITRMSKWDLRGVGAPVVVMAREIEVLRELEQIAWKLKADGNMRIVMGMVELIEVLDKYQALKEE